MQSHHRLEKAFNKVLCNYPTWKRDPYMVPENQNEEIKRELKRRCTEEERLKSALKAAD